MLNSKKWDLAKCALLTIDLQNDFIHPEGAYGRANQSVESISALPDKISPLVKAIRNRGGRYFSAQFTLVPDIDGEPLIAPHLIKLRPFLKRGDFKSGEFGHSLVKELYPADFVIEKVAYSAFFQTRLEFIMRAVGIESLIIGGIVTNGGVASTLRDAHLRNIETVMLTDGCAAFKTNVHEATILSLSSLTHQYSYAEVLSCLERKI